MTDSPNVVLCLTDQLRPFEIGCYGGRAHTPGIDSLARNGVRFEIACSNQPSCTAARSILVTGQYARTCAGTLLNCEEPVPEREKLLSPTLAEVFKASGYHTGLIGKWHIHPQPELVGFDDVYYPHYSHRYTGQTYFGNGRRAELVEGFNADAELAEARRWLAARGTEPFFLFYNISQPHMPLWDMPDRFKRMYSPDEVVIRDNAEPDAVRADDHYWFRVYLYDYLYYRHNLPYTDKIPDGFGLRHLTALYWGSISWADHQLAELMKSLDDHGLTDNTIVVFTSDHGDLLGSHNLFNKNSPYDEALRVPLIVSWPAKLAPNTVRTQAASLVDLMPTVLSLAGIEAPQSVQGTDLSPVILGKAESAGENAAYFEIRPRQWGIRTLTHCCSVGDRPEDNLLFDAAKDPYEMDNLAGRKEHATVEAELRSRVQAWNARTPWAAFSG